MNGRIHIPDDIRYRGPGQGGAGGGGGMPSMGGGGSRLPPPVGAGAGGIVVLPPTTERPPDAIDFNPRGTLTGRTSANTPAVFAGATFQVPAGNVAVIKSISILANTLLLTSDLEWSLRFDGNAVEGWNSLSINPRAAGSVELTWGPEETSIPVPEGSEISWAFTVNDANAYQVSVYYHGWFYSTAIADRFAGAYGG